MALINNHYEFLQPNEALYVVDTYDTHLGNALEFNDGFVKLKNYNTNQKSDNFYGDGRHGHLTKNDTLVTTIRNFYFEGIENHPIYGPCIKNIWWENTALYNTSNIGTFNKGDEFYIMKKHIEKMEYMGEYGKWDVVTIKEKIIDSDGVHISIERLPENSYDTTTANAAQLVLQFKSLTINNNYNYVQDLSVAASVITIPYWSDRKISLPSCVIYIKAQEYIYLGENTYIANRYGHNAGYAYKYYSHVYAAGGGPMGAGVDSVRGPNATNPNILDPSSPYEQGMQGPGGPGFYGINRGTYINSGNSFESTSDLNDKLFVGNGSSAANYTSNPLYGCNGGGIVVIQTPKLTIKNNAYIGSFGSILGSAAAITAAANGSMLIKAREIEVDPVVKNIYTGDITSVSSNHARFRNNTVIGTTIGTPGLLQIEMDKITIGETLYTISDLESDSTPFDNLIESTHMIPIQNDANNKPPFPWVYEPAKFNANYSSPLYETGKHFKLYTAGLHNIDISKWFRLTNIKLNANLPEGTEVKMLFSLDKGLTWFKIDFALRALISKTLNQLSDGNTILELNDFVDETFYTNKFIITNTSKTIDVAIGLKTDNSHITPILDSVIFTYDESIQLKAPITILPFNGEEFNNEEVNFVWLQPEQQFGSVQNRLEISTNESFSQDFIETKPNFVNSSNTTRIHIPYKSAEYDNTISEVSYFKLPHMKRRNIKITAPTQENTASIVWVPDTRTIKYQGLDEFFYKGDTIQLPPMDDIVIPNINEEAPLISQMVNIPQESNLKVNIVMSGITDKTQIEDKKGFLTLDSIDNDNIIENTIYQNTSLKFNSAGSTGVIFKKTTNTDVFLAKHLQEMTYHIKINPGDLAEGYNVLFFNKFSNNLIMEGLYLYHTNGNQYSSLYWHNNNTSYLIAGFYNYVDSRTTKVRQAIKKYSENNITITIGSDNILKCYINGYYAGEYPTGHYHNRETYISANPSVTGIITEIGIANNIYKFGGYIREISIWDTKLNQEEIKEISKLPIYDLRYNTNNNTYKLHQFPYRDHIKYHPSLDNNTEWDKAGTYGTYNLLYRGEIAPFYMGGIDQSFYESNHDSIRLGTYIPGKNQLVSWEPNKLTHIPIDGINGVVTKENATSRIDKFTYKDNNSFITNDNLFTSKGFITQNRFNARETDVEVSFVYHDKYNNVKDGLFFKLGAFDHASQLGTYADYLILTNDVNGLTVYLHYYDSGNAARLIYNNIPFNTITQGKDLKPGHVYTLRYNSNANPSNTTITIYSPSDVNFMDEVLIHSYNLYARGTYGYNSTDWNDVAPVRGYPYTNALAGISDGGGTMSLISINTKNANSIKNTYAGYKDTYLIENKLEANYTNKINSIEVNANVYDANAYIKFAISFNDGVTWRKYDSTSKIWSNITVANIRNNGMTAEDIMSLTTRIFEVGGFQEDQDVYIRTYLFSNDSSVTPFLEKIKININGPIIIDSWDEPGSFYDPTKTFKYLKDASWSPYLEVDTTAGSSQNWINMGSGIPSPMKFVAGNGSYTTYGTNKCFATVKVNLVPKGKYYWRVASYNAK